MTHEHPTGHGHGAAGLTDDEIRALFEPSAWDERYRDKRSVWSGNPNAQLVAETSGLAAGTALDVGCGDGVDAIWLAGRGWRATGLDFSAAGLERAAALAAEAGVSDRTDWRQADARTWRADGDRWDLVTSHFIHLPGGGMTGLVGRLADAVAPGGTLLVVGHHPRDLETGLRWSVDDVMFAPEDLLAGLDTAGWDVRTEVRTRQEGRPGVDPQTVHDSVLVARRS